MADYISGQLKEPYKRQELSKEAFKDICQRATAKVVASSTYQGLPNEFLTTARKKKVCKAGLRGFGQRRKGVDVERCICGTWRQRAVPWLMRRRLCAHDVN